MKDIYIRQLTAAGAQPGLTAELEARVGELTQQLAAARTASSDEVRRSKEDELRGGP